MKEITWDMIAQVVTVIGTGSWLSYVVRGHGRRLAGMKKAIEDLEKSLPVELEKRLRMVEKEKLSVDDHARICSSALRHVELMVASIKETVEKHAARLAKGDDLFRELAVLVGEFRATVSQCRTNGFNGKNGGGL